MCSTVLGHTMNKLTSASGLDILLLWKQRGSGCLSVTCSHLTRIIAAKFLKLFRGEGRGVGDAKNVRLMSRAFEMHSLIKLLFLLFAPGRNNRMLCIEDSMQSFLPHFLFIHLYRNCFKIQKAKLKSFFTLIVSKGWPTRVAEIPPHPPAKKF